MIKSIGRAVLVWATQWSANHVSSTFFKSCVLSGSVRNEREEEREKGDINREGERERGQLGEVDMEWVNKVQKLRDQ